MNYIKNIYIDEIRNGFLVTSDKKKLWNAQIEILLEFDRICKKYNLIYYAEGGTLLGAARHGGFIPWDDDIDLIMFRPDYNRLCQIAPYEFKEPYFFQNIYTDDFALMITKIRRSDTSAIENIEMLSSYNQGIFIDIWPMDDKSDGTPRNNRIYEIKNLLFTAISDPDMIEDMLNRQVEMILPASFMNRYLNLSIRDKFKEYEIFCENHFGESSLLCCDFAVNTGKKTDILRKWYDKIIMLPFENIKVPVPYEYDKVLTAEYGNWHELVKDGRQHASFISTDIPYRDLLK